MTVSGVSLLASKLSHRKSTSASLETVKLSESTTSVFNVPQTKEDFKQELHALLEQSGQCERSLVSYHDHLNMANALINHMRLELFRMYLDRYVSRLKVYAMGRFRHPRSSRPFGIITDSVNLNDTLRSLAQQLDSPIKSSCPSVNESQISVTAPFATRRPHNRAK
jgi:hypothetical protein